MYLFKRAHNGKKVNPHRDGSYLLTHKHPLIGFWFALEDATVDNACLYGVPGSHKYGLSYEWVRGQQGRMDYVPTTTLPKHSLEEYKRRDDHSVYVPMEAKAGTLIVMHGHFLHKSDENKSEKSREAYTVHFVDPNDFDRERNWIRKQFIPLF